MKNSGLVFISQTLSSILNSLYTLNRGKGNMSGLQTKKKAGPYQSLNSRDLRKKSNLFYNAIKILKDMKLKKNPKINMEFVNKNEAHG